MKKRSIRFIIYLLVLAIALAATLPGVNSGTNRMPYLIAMSVLIGIWLITVFTNEIIIARKNKK